MVATGIVSAGPYQFIFFRAAERFLPGRSASAVIKKLVISSTLAPINLAGIFTASNFFLGNSSDMVAKRIKEELFQTWATGLLYWPAVNLLILKIVPVPHQPHVNSLAGAGQH